MNGLLHQIIISRRHVVVVNVNTSLKQSWNESESVI